MHALHAICHLLTSSCALGLDSNETAELHEPKLKSGSDVYRVPCMHRMLEDEPKVFVKPNRLNKTGISFRAETVQSHAGTV